MKTESKSQKQNDGKMMQFILGILGLIMILLAFMIGISDNFPGILLLLLGSFLLLYAFLYRLRGTGNLSPLQKLLYWTPRTFCIVFILFSSLFALDVFGESQSVWQTILALLMHLIPTFILITILVVTWRREWIGGILFILLGILYVVMYWGRFPLMTYSLISGPLVIIGILFLLNWKYRVELRPNKKK